MCARVCLCLCPREERKEKWSDVCACLSCERLERGGCCVVVAIVECKIEKGRERESGVERAIGGRKSVMCRVVLCIERKKGPREWERGC